jgi:hypothetical protein
MSSDKPNLLQNTSKFNVISEKSIRNVLGNKTDKEDSDKKWNRIDWAEKVQEDVIAKALGIIIENDGS